MKKQFWRNLFESSAKFIKNKKVFFIPLGALVVISAVFGGLLIDSIYLAVLATIAGVTLGTLIFQGNKKLFRQLSSSQKANKHRPLICVVLYLLVLLLLCGSILFLIGIYRFDMLLFVGLTLVFQLFFLSLVEAIHSIKQS